MRKKSFIERAMSQWRITFSVCAALMAVGVVSFLTMPRQEFPDFTIRQGIVVGVMPGASSREVEEQVAKVVEEYLFSFNEVDKAKTHSVSSEGQVVVFVELRPTVKGPDAPAFWAKLRHGLNELKAQRLPSQVVALIGNNDFGDTSALIFTIVADGRSPRELQEYTKVLEEQLRRLDATAKLRRYGVQDEVIRVTVSRERLARYAIRPALLMASLQGLGAAPMPARLDGPEIELPVHVSRVLDSEREVGDTVLLALPNGDKVRIKDVAEIHREYGHDDSYVRTNGKAALVLSIEMQSGNDITHFGDQVDEAMRAAQAELPPGVVISRIADQPNVVRTSVGGFLRDFGLSILAVIFVMMLLLPMRVAAVAAVTVPICIVITLAILNVLGVQLQTVSLAALIVVLGMVVDNSIVIIDDHVDRLDRGEDRWSAAWKSAHGLFVPVFSATVAILMAYVPMAYFLADNMAGDFIGSLPVTVTVALLVSLAVSALIVPSLNAWLIRRGIHREGKRSLLDLLQRGFDRALEAAFRHPIVTVLLGIGSVAAALAIFTELPQSTFPKIERNQFAVEVYLPSGRSLAQTDAVIRRIEADLLADPRVQNVTSFIGTSSPRFHAMYAPHMPGRNYGQLVVNTTDDRAAVAVLTEKEEALRGAFPEAWVKWKQLDFRPGSAVEVRLSGREIPDLKAYAARLEDSIRGIPGTTWVRDDYEEPLQTIVVAPDLEACAQLGVPPALLQASLAVGLNGLPIGTIREGDYPVKVVLQDRSADGTSLDGLAQQYVSSTQLAASVPLAQVATIGPAFEEGAIVRRNGVRTLTVQVDLAMGVLALDVQKEVEAILASMPPPAGVRVAFGGEVDLMQEVYPPFARSLAASIVLIFLVLLCQFQRFRRAGIVMLTMPLCLFGAVVGLVVTGYPFGMTSFMAIIGLMGIVVRNGIILIGYAEELRQQGASVREAALAAGKRRMRPIYLTSMAAAIGVIPMILSGSSLWGPLGAVTCFGLLFGMITTLFVLPVAYWLVSGRNRPGTPPPSPTPATGVVIAALLALVSAVPTASAQEGPLSLERARDLAAMNNSGVHESRLEVQAARQTKDAAFTKYFPQVSASATAFAFVDPPMSIHSQGGNLPVWDGVNKAGLAAPTQFAYMPAGNMTAMGRGAVETISAVQPLFTGGRIVYGNHLATKGVQIAEDRAALAARDARAQTDEKYWRLVGLSSKLEILEAADRLLVALAAEVGDAASSGLVTRNDAMKVALQTRRIVADRQRLMDGIALATLDLRHHIGLPGEGPLALADVPPTPEDPAGLAVDREGAVDRRTETKLLEKVVDAQRLQTAMKRGEYLPSVAIGAAVMRMDIKGMQGMTNLAGMATVSIPLTGIWEGMHHRDAQRLQVAIAMRRLEDTRELLELDVQRGWNDLVAAWRQVGIADEAVAQADVDLAEATDRHKAGVATLSDLLDSQVRQRKAREERADARIEYALKRAAYLRAVGR